MIFSRYDSFEDPDCYPGSFVLKNRAGLRKQEDLDAFETTMVSIRSAEAMIASFQGKVELLEDEIAWLCIRSWLRRKVP